MQELICLNLIQLKGSSSGSCKSKTQCFSSVPYCHHVMPASQHMYRNYTHNLILIVQAMEMICMATSRGIKQAMQLYSRKEFEQIPKFDGVLKIDFEEHLQASWWLWQTNRLLWVADNMAALTVLAKSAKYNLQVCHS